DAFFKSVSMVLFLLVEFVNVFRKQLLFIKLLFSVQTPDICCKAILELSIEGVEISDSSL
ncbi:hypothetical protein ACQP3C_29585, partial [Escherichia coli]